MNIQQLLSKFIGVVFILLSLFIWATYSYPDVNPFWPGAVLHSGTFGMMINWVIVCIVAGIGVGFWKGSGKY